MCVFFSLIFFSFNIIIFASDKFLYVGWLFVVAININWWVKLFFIYIIFWPQLNVRSFHTSCKHKTSMINQRNKENNFKRIINKNVNKTSVILQFPIIFFLHNLSISIPQKYTVKFASYAYIRLTTRILIVMQIGCCTLFYIIPIFLYLSH